MFAGGNKAVKSLSSGFKLKSRKILTRHCRSPCRGSLFPPRTRSGQSSGLHRCRVPTQSSSRSLSGYPGCAPLQVSWFECNQYVCHLILTNTIEFFRNEFYRINRIYRICRRLFLVIFISKQLKIVFYKFYRFYRIKFRKARMVFHYHYQMQMKWWEHKVSVCSARW